MRLSAPTQAPTRYAEVGNVVEVGDEKEAEEKAPTSLSIYPGWPTATGGMAGWLLDGWTVAGWLPGTDD
jgi:hypothetical protein